MADFESEKSGGRRSLDRIVMLGMNNTASLEAAAMRRGGDEVRLIDPKSSENGFFTYAGRRFDLSRTNDSEALGRALGLDPDRARVFARVLERRNIKARDELAGLGAAFAESELGLWPFGRLVLSGHSTGEEISGTENGEVRLYDLETFAELFPRAAARIEHVKLAACETGAQSNHDRLFEYYPNLRTSTAFDGRGALAEAGGAQDLARWAKATRGPVDRLDPRYARGLRRGDKISIQTRQQGFVTRRPAPSLQKAMAAYEEDRPEVVAYSERGQESSAWATRVRLTAHYDAIQTLLRCKDLPKEMRVLISSARDHVVRLRHEKEIVRAFVRHFTDALKATYRELGRPMPNLDRLTRRALIEHIAMLERVSTDASESTKSTIVTMRAALIDMTPEAAPFDWI